MKGGKNVGGGKKLQESEGENIIILIELHFKASEAFGGLLIVIFIRIIARFYFSSSEILFKGENDTLRGKKSMRSNNSFQLQSHKNRIIK